MFSNMDQALGMPMGSVRAIISLSVVLAFLASVFTGHSAELKDVALIVIGFYFATKGSGIHQRSSNDGEHTESGHQN